MFRGRTFVIVGDVGPNLRTGFDHVDPGVRVLHAENGVPIASWTVWVCRGFHGFTHPAADGTSRY